MHSTPLFITDIDGDKLEVERALREGYKGGSFLTTESRDGSDSSSVVLTREQGLQVAAKLIDNAGGSVVPVADLKLASDLPFNEAVMRVAAAHKRTVEFRYAKEKGGYIESRRFNPEAIVGKGEALAATGTDPDRDGPRRFRFDRIKGEVSFA